MKQRFSKVAVGGTFDELHKGHKALLMKAFEIGELVQIGLCSDSFVRKLGKPHATAPYAHRLAELKAFLSRSQFLNRAQVFLLGDPYGITLSNGGVEALVVSKETEPTAVQINEQRKTKALPPLEIIAIEMIPSENHVPISTTRIRRGEIDRDGHLLRKIGKTV